jgi:hypothetical protein
MTNQARLLFSFMAGCALIIGATKCAAQAATPTPFEISDEELSKISEEDIAKTDVHRKKLLAEAETSAGNVVEVAIEQGASIAAIMRAREEAARALDNYTKATEEQINKGNKAIAGYSKVKGKLRMVGWAMCALILGIAGYVALKMPGFGIYAGAGIAISGCAAVWAWILL